MRKTYRPYDPDQQLLLPAALQEWLPPDHLAYFVSDVVDQSLFTWQHRRLWARPHLRDHFGCPAAPVDNALLVPRVLGY